MPISVLLICERPAVELGVGGHARHRPGPVGGVGPVDVRLEGRQVDLDDLVEELLRVGVDLGVLAEVLAHGVGPVGHGLPPGGLQVDRAVVVVGEQRRGGADLGAHVADRGLAGGADRRRAGAEVLDDGAGAAADGQHVGDLEDDVLGRRPVRSSRR